MSSVRTTEAKKRLARSKNVYVNTLEHFEHTLNDFFSFLHCFFFLPFFKFYISLKSETASTQLRCHNNNEW